MQTKSQAWWQLMLTPSVLARCATVPLSLGNFVPPYRGHHWRIRAAAPVRTRARLSVL